MHQIPVECSGLFCLEGKAHGGAYCWPVTLKRFVRQVAVELKASLVAE